MNCRSRRHKLRHMDVLECSEQGSTADGTKPLWDPLSTTAAAAASTRQRPGLIPRQRVKNGQMPPTNNNVTKPHTGFSSALLDGVDDGFDVLDDSMSARMAHMADLAEMADVNKDRVSKDPAPMGGGFVSARQYMNPTYYLTEEEPVRPKGTVPNKTIKDSLASSTAQKSSANAGRGKAKGPIQKNLVVNYFKPLPSDSSRSSMDGRSDDGCTPVNSPHKSIMTSPIKKLEGSDTIYYCTSPISSQGCGSLSQSSSNGTTTSSNGIAAGTSSSTSSGGSGTGTQLCQRIKPDDDDLDFEAPFDHIWESSSKRKNTPGQSGVPNSKKKLKMASATSTPCPLTKPAKLDRRSAATSDNLKQDISTDKFGLFGFSDNTLIQLDSDSDFGDESSGEDWFSTLPTEVVTNILCRLPFIDMCLNINRVCLAWRDLISSDTFMPWKKCYHRLLKEDKTEWETMMEHLKAGGMTSPSLYLPNLVRFLKPYKPRTANMLEKRLRLHHLYSCACDLIVERFSDCMLAPKEPNPWCVIAVIVLLSESVYDITEIFRYLLGCRSQCTAEELIDCLYCIASFLHIFKTLRLNDVWTGMHYRLYYALYLYENDSLSTVSGLGQALQQQTGQQSLRRYIDHETPVRLTHEQLRICNYNISLGEIIKIVAFAGTGKTTTLLEYARLRPNLKFLLIVFNKSVAEHAKGRFPPNVDCSTSHSLAYKSVGWKYANANKLCSNMKVTDLTSQLRMRKGEHLFTQAKLVIDTLNSFMASADDFITTVHVPTTVKNKDNQLVPIEQSRRMALAEDAEMMWQLMIDLRETKVRMPHDGYLKLWQLRRPKFTNHNIVMIDEAQDLTPAVADIFRSQTMARIMVGDPHQQIYAFRGAVNAMDLVSATHTFYLTQSFRFGPEISAVAASCLELLKKEKKKILVGSGVPGGVDGQQEGQLAIITRTNFTLFREAVAQTVFSKTGNKIAFAGGHQAFGFDMIDDIYSLMSEQSDEDKKSSITNPLVRCFIVKGFAELEKFANHTVDVELIGKIKIAKAYGHLLKQYIPTIISKCVRDPSMADIVLSTAHKAKGLEFDTVRITEDFYDEERPAGATTETIINQNGEVVAVGVNNNNNNAASHSQPPVNLQDEYNLLYVAITRAKKRLIMSPMLRKLLRRVGEDFGRLVPTTRLRQEGAAFFCCVNKEPFEPRNVLTFYRRKITQSNGSTVEAEMLSPEVVSDQFPCLRNIAGVLS